MADGSSLRACYHHACWNGSGYSTSGRYHSVKLPLIGAGYWPYSESQSDYSCLR